MRFLLHFFAFFSSVNRDAAANLFSQLCFAAFVVSSLEIFTYAVFSSIVAADGWFRCSCSSYHRNYTIHTWNDPTATLIRMLKIGIWILFSRNDKINGSLKENQLYWYEREALTRLWVVFMFEHIKIIQNINKSTHTPNRLFMAMND